MVKSFYPNFENKHLEEALFSAKDFIEYSKIKKKDFPKKWIITFQKTIENYVKSEFKAKKDKDYSSVQSNVYFLKNLGVIKSNGVGSPHAVTFFEELIASGAKDFILIGTAGGLQDFGIFLCEKAIRDEGTSYHYVEHGKYSYPDKDLTNKFEKAMKRQGLVPIRGTTWTVDAPYRETRAEIQHYKKEGVKTVEMEASALLAVAKVRKVRIAAAFSVSDIVGGEKWDPQFHEKHVKRKLKKLFDAAVECLKK
jgi:uridine phosphorylase